MDPGDAGSIDKQQPAKPGNSKTMMNVIIYLSREGI